MIAPVHVILNPTSGGGKGRRVRAEIERELSRRGVLFTLEETRYPGHAVDLAREAAARGVGTVIAAGGDGTVHEVSNGLLRARQDRLRKGDGPVLGVVPIGTGNDFIKVVSGSMDRERAYAVLAAGEVHYFDVGRVSWEGGAEYFVNGAGTGIDVEVVRQVKRMPRLPGVVSYLVGLFRALVWFESIPVRVRLDAEAIEQKVMIVAIGNGRCIGGGFYVAPTAEPDDGRLDVCIVQELDYLGIARVLPRVMRGTHGALPEVIMRQARSIEIEATGPAPLFFQLDGELREPRNARRLRIELEHSVLPVLAQPAAVRAGGGVRLVESIPMPGGLG